MGRRTLETSEVSIWTTFSAPWTLGSRLAGFGATLPRSALAPLETSSTTTIHQGGRQLHQESFERNHVVFSDDASDFGLQRLNLRGFFIGSLFVGLVGLACWAARAL